MISQEERNSIDQVCKEYGIENYTINDDGSIDVNGNVDLNWNRLERFPINFNKVSGDFECISCGLVTLEGGPKEVGGSFNMFGNVITSLEYCPKVVGGNFHCRRNVLTSLEFSPVEVGGFNCTDNQLTSLEYCPTEIHNRFECDNNLLPGVMSEYFIFYRNTMEKHMTFVKYQSYYDVWLPMFNIDGFNELVAEINDGLK